MFPKFLVLLLIFVLISEYRCVDDKFPPIKNIAIIGAGTTGLISAKLAVDRGFNVTVFEQNEELGGTWWYTDEIGKNKYGIDVHTSAYEGLR